MFRLSEFLQRSIRRFPLCMMEHGKHRPSFDRCADAYPHAAVDDPAETDWGWCDRIRCRDGDVARAHQWMQWAENRDSFTAERMEIRNRHVMASFLLRESVELIGIETQTGEAVVWCGFHDIDWQARHCDTGFWVRKSAQGRGVATEAANAMVRYAFGALGMQRVGLTHSRGNEASRRIAEKLGFALERIQAKANLLPGGRAEDRYCYARFNVAGLPELEVTWGL